MTSSAPTPCSAIFSIASSTDWSGRTDKTVLLGLFFSKEWILSPNFIRHRSGRTLPRGSWAPIDGRLWGRSLDSRTATQGYPDGSRRTSSRVLGALLRTFGFQSRNRGPQPVAQCVFGRDLVRIQ